MSGSEKLSYLVPRNPSIKCWNDRVKLNFPLRENVVKLGLDACEELPNEKLKVYLRIKPCQVDFNPYSIFNNTLEAEAPGDNGACKKLSKNVGKLINKFHFTTIFSPESTQETVFEKCVLANLKRFIGGRNDLLFAYGTTNAGKTFTMQGTVENPGMIPRAIQFIFKCLGENIENTSRYQPFRYDEVCTLDDEELRKSILHKNFILNLNLSKYQRHPELSWRSYKADVTASNSEYSDAYENETFREMEKNLENLKYEVEDDGYSVWMSMIEIYNEQIYDLLEVPSEREMRVKLGFAEDENGKVYIKNLRYIRVTNGHEAFQVFEFGRANLRLGPTALNYWSSRSHCICTLTLGRFSKKENSTCIALSRFSFCDLAGAERVKKALAEGNRLVESKSINTSLSIFAKCLSVIRENQSNGEKRIVPYRESKLTRLFRDAMMGRETFSIIVNVTPESHLFNETLNVLKFSAVARQIVPINVIPKQKRIKPIARSKVAKAVSNTNGNYNINWDADDVVVKEDEKTVIEIEHLLKLIDQLKKQVTDERKRAENIENNVRKEFENKFSEVIYQAEKQRNLFECENKRIRGVCDREKQRLMEHYEERERKLKRKRLEEDSSDYVEMETQIETLKKDLDFLKCENSSLKDLIQQMNSKTNILQKKCSQMQFDLSEKDRILSLYKRKVEDPESDEVVKDLENQLLLSISKNAELKELLDENEFDYKDLMVTNTLIKEENVRLLSDLATTSVVVDDLKRELRDYEKMLSLKTKQIEELESRLDETTSDVLIESYIQNDKVYNVVDLEEFDEEIGNVKEDRKREKSITSVSSSDDSELGKLLNNSGDENSDEDLTCKRDGIEKKNGISGPDNNQRNRELTLPQMDAGRNEENLIDYDDLIKLVDVLKEDIAAERERADNVESRVRKELETKFAEIIEQQILKERDMFQSEKQRMGEAFDRKRVRLTECYEEKLKNLTAKCNEQTETIKLLTEELQRITAQNADNEKKQDELKFKELTEKNDALMEELNSHKNEKIHLEKLLNERKCDCEKEKRSIFTFISNIIRKFETAEINDIAHNLEFGAEENITQMFEEKILKLLEEDEMNRREIKLLRNENDELKKAATFNFKLVESPRDYERDETISMDELTKKSENKEKFDMKENEISGENRNENEGESEKENVADSVREFKTDPDSECENELIDKSTPHRLSREIEKLSILYSESTNKSCRKTVDAIDKNIHPSLIKRFPKSKKKGKGKWETEAERNEEASKDCKKEEASIKNKGKKCTKKLFVENDFDDICDLESSFAEPEIPRLRPRKK